MSPAPSGAGRPVVRCFPSADRAFAAEVGRLVDELPDATDKQAPQHLERLIQKRYPAARVSPQDPLASFGGGGHVWYVYRRDAPPTPETQAAAPPADARTAGASQPPGEHHGGASTEPDGTSSEGPVGGFGARPVYSVAATAAMIGVPIAIIVGWDDQDNFVRPSTTPTGARLYSRDDLEDLMTVKRRVTAGGSPDDIRADLEAARQRRRGGPFSGTGSDRRILVLLAERDPYAAEMAEYFLRTEGYDVDVAFSAQEAESRALERSPDIAVVELLISGGGGAELCARLKAQPGRTVLAISTLDFEDVALRSGADAFLTKPLDPLQLISTIKDLLGESALLRHKADQ